MYPFRYVDKTKFHLIKDLRTDGDTVQLKGQLVSIEKIRGKNKRYRLQGLLKDSTGFIELIWFQGVKYLADALKEGEEYVVYGKVTIYSGKKNIAHPEMESVKKRAAEALQTTFDPVYPSTIHFPKNEAEKALATNRIKFEELFYLQLRLLLGKENRKRKLKGAVFDTVGQYFNGPIWVMGST